MADNTILIPATELAALFKEDRSNFGLMRVGIWDSIRSL